MEQYKSGEIDKSALENQIREYSSSRTIRAIEEFVAESTSTGKADSRINYDYFDNLLQIQGGVTQEVSELIEKIKDEFNQTVYAIKDKCNRAASEMENFGIHINQAYGFLGMSLLTADQKNISQVLNGFDFIHRLSTNQDLVVLQQDISENKSDLPIKNITTLFVSPEFTACKPDNNFGLQQALSDGKEFPEAMREACVNRKRFLELTAFIHEQIESSRIANAARKQRKADNKEIETVRKTISLETNKHDEKQVPTKTISTPKRSSFFQEQLKRFFKIN